MIKFLDKTIGEADERAGLHRPQAAVGERGGLVGGYRGVGAVQ